jgi:hypothetical protein
MGGDDQDGIDWDENADGKWVVVEFEGRIWYMMISVSEMKVANPLIVSIYHHFNHKTKVALLA